MLRDSFAECPQCGPRKDESLQLSYRIRRFYAIMRRPPWKAFLCTAARASSGLATIKTSCCRIPSESAGFKFLTREPRAISFRPDASRQAALQVFTGELRTYQHTLFWRLYNS